MTRLNEVLTGRKKTAQYDSHGAVALVPSGHCSQLQRSFIDFHFSDTPNG
jgi:hypothetical protein